MRIRTAIVGYGAVGKAMQALLPDAVIYDTAPGMPNDRDAVNECGIAFVCVPTPCSPDGTCDISAVEEVISWLRSPLIVLRSTVPPGTTESLAGRYGKRLVFQPEYMGETHAHPLADLRGRDFIVLGGVRDDTAEVAAAYSEVYHSSIQFFFTDATTAELAKYMENCFYAAKVVFCSEFHMIARTFGVAYNELREIWLADPRISRDHTFVYPDNVGFGGKCLPKDVSALIEFARSNGFDPALMKAVRDINDRYRTAAMPPDEQPGPSAGSGPAHHTSDE